MLILQEDRNFITNFYYATYHFSILFIIVIIYNTKFSEKFISFTIKYYKVLIIIAIIATLIQVINYDFLNIYKFKGTRDFSESIYVQRRYSIFGFENTDAIGFSFIPITALLLSYMLMKKEKFAWVFTIIVGFIALLSNSRFTMVGFIISTFLYIVYSKNTFKGISKYSFLILFLAIVGYFALTAYGFDFLAFYNQRFLDKGSIENTTRVRAFYTFAIFFPKHPIFGTGEFLTDEIARASRIIASSSRIHVGYLSQLVGYGIVGAFLLWTFWFLLAKKLYNNAKKTKYWGSFFAFLIYFWAHATLVNDSIFFSGLIFALIFDKYFTDKLKNNLIQKIT
jgi:hypothetical protein